MATMTASDIMLNVLMNWGVEVIFGMPGDGINGIMEALRKKQEHIRFIQVRHEEAAALAACGYAKYSGKLGVCLATSGPGGIHLLNGLYDAKLDGAPVLAITGMHFHDLLSTFAQQDVELDKLFEDVALYNARVMGPEHVENVTELACRSALSKRGVAHITIPTDYQDKEVSRKESSPRNVSHHVSQVMTQDSRTPSTEDFTRAAKILNHGRKIAILAGRGAFGATDELIQIAELLGAPIIKALLGKAVVPDDSIYTTGGIGLLGTRPSQEAMEECDTLLIVGSSFPYIEFLPKPGQCQAVQIDSNPQRIGLRYPVNVGLVGDSQQSLRNLVPLLRRNDHRAFLQDAQAKTEKWWQLMKARGSVKSIPMKPQVVAWELGQRLSPDAILSCDSGTVATWFARQIPVRRGQMHSLSGNLATMGCGLPYAIGAALAHPDRQIVAFVGDGGFSMMMAEFLTCVKHKLNVKLVVLKNNTLGQIKWEQMVFLGNPEYGCDLQPMDFTGFANACGGTGFKIDDPALCGETLSRALETPGPVLIEAEVDPHEPPMPAKLKPDQALKFAESLARGQPNREKIVMTILADRVRQLI
ncbi:MAG: pyruvate oxidase [Bdellovibrionales bacterium RIFOXYC1_FULL_54_43]|nr:MAG: pyruvate oxidase [Bdellovibrionales bacterium RIFOXYC1_FULL_54_43]OFZ82287.1 MAG: pyruvate oxidase [Bdellovibrionales bacterium RIFOXYD1_FULL_55_31]